MHHNSLLRTGSAYLLGVCAAFALTLAGPAAPAAAQEAPWPTDGWATSTPEAQGLDAGPLEGLKRKIEGGGYGHIDRLVIIKNGFLVVNERYENDYEAISKGHQNALGCGADTCPDEAELNEYNYLHPDFHPYYQGRDVHSLQSVTKSVTSALIGVAIERGEIDGVQAPLLSFFEDYDLSKVDDRLRQATLEDLLTMRSGIEWHEVDRPLDETNTTLQLEHSDDWIQFTLDQPMDAAPGEKWSYNSGGSHLMSGVIRQATGQYADAYARAYLFEPLGISDYHWKKTPKGYPDTEGGLYLEAEQLAKLGYLYLRDGVWDEQRIVPEGWVEASTNRHAERVNPQGWGYGYQWWRLDRSDAEIWAGLGFGEQYLLVLPEHDLIAVVNSWNLFEPPQASILGALLGMLMESVSNGQ
jgi:CubicO group peptidase (beta-lactamase class C family)